MSSAASAERSWLTSALGERLADGHHLVELVGNSGCGKTTALRALKSALQSQRRRVLAFECPTSEERRLGSGRRLVVDLALQALGMVPDGDLGATAARRYRMLERMLVDSQVGAMVAADVVSGLLGPVLDSLASPSAPVVVLIDGIDQDEGSGSDAAVAVVAALVQYTGDDVQIVVSSTEGSTALERLAAQQPSVLSFDDPVFRSEVEHDLREHLDGLGVPDDLTEGAREQVVRASAGSFYVLEAAVGAISMASAESTPAQIQANAKLADLVTTIVHRFDGGDVHLAERLLALIAQFEAPLPLDFVAQVVRLDLARVEAVIGRMRPIVRIGPSPERWVEVTHWTHRERIETALPARADGAAGELWTALCRVLDPTARHRERASVRSYAEAFGTTHVLRTLRRTRLRRLSRTERDVVEALFRAHLRPKEGSPEGSRTMGAGGSAGSATDVAIAAVLVADALAGPPARRRLTRRLRRVRAHASPSVRASLPLAVQQLGHLEPDATTTLFECLLRGRDPARLVDAAVLLPLVSDPDRVTAVVGRMALVPSRHAQTAADALLASWRSPLRAPCDVLADAAGDLETLLSRRVPPPRVARWLTFAAHVSLAAFYRDPTNTHLQLTLAAMWTRLLHTRGRRQRRLLAWGATRLIGARLGDAIRGLGTFDTSPAANATPLVHYCATGEIAALDVPTMWTSLDSNSGYEVFTALAALARSLLDARTPPPWTSLPAPEFETVRARRWLSALACVCASHPDLTRIRREQLTSVLHGELSQIGADIGAERGFPVFAGHVAAADEAAVHRLMAELDSARSELPEGVATELLSEFFDSLAVASYLQREAVATVIGSEQFARVATEQAVRANARAFALISWNMPAARRYGDAAKAPRSVDLVWARRQYETVGLLGAAVEFLRFYPRLRAGVFLPNLEAFARLGVGRRMDRQFSRAFYQSLRREEFTMTTLLAGRRDHFAA